MECLEKSGICRIILFRIAFRNRLPSDYDDTRSNSDERARQRQKISSQYLFSIDWIKKTCWKEIVNLAGYEVTTL
jgi:hypothetical protein